MPSEEVSLSCWKNPYVTFWGLIIVILITTFEQCRKRFELFDELCNHIGNAITWFLLLIQKSLNVGTDQSPKIVSTEYSSSSMVTIDLEDISYRNFRIYEDAVARFTRSAIFSRRPRHSRKRVNVFRYPKSMKLALVKRRVFSESSSSDEELIESPKNYNTISRFAKFLTEFLGITPPVFGKEINSREYTSGYEADTESGLENNLEMEVVSNKRDHMKVQEGKLTGIIDSLDGNMIGSNKNHGGSECNTDGPLEGKFNSRITSCTFQNEYLPSELHGDSIERYGKSYKNTKCLEHQLSNFASEDKFEFNFYSCQKNQSWFKEYYDRLSRRSATCSGLLASFGGFKFSYTRKSNEEEAMNIERESIHSNGEVEEDTSLRSNNITWQFLHRDLVPMHVRCFIRDTDSESSDQEDDSNHKLKENAIAEVYEEGAPNASKTMAISSRANDIFYNSSEVEPKIQFDDIPRKTRNLRKQLLAKNVNLAVAKYETDLPTSVEKDVREFSRARNSSMEDVGESTA